MTISFKNQECWARCLGDCSKKMSGEHIFSNCLLGDMVEPYGFKKIPSKLIGKKNAKAKILCKNHNNRLGTQVDYVSKSFNDGLKKFHSLFRNPVWFPNSQDGFPISVNGILLERWTLKTIINSIYLEHGVDPDPFWVSVAFGLRKIDPGTGLGLYLIKSTNGDQWKDQQILEMMPRIFPVQGIDEQLLYGARVQVSGFSWFFRMSAGNSTYNHEGIICDDPRCYRPMGIFAMNDLGFQHDTPIIKFSY